MLRHVLFVMLVSFSEWLWAGSSLSSVSCPVKQVKSPVCPLQKKLYLDLGVSKLLSTHLSSAQSSTIISFKEEAFKINFGIYPARHGTGIFPNTMQIGVGYAWFRSSVNGGVLPYVSTGVEYRQMNPMHSPLTLTAKVFGGTDKKKFSADYKFISLQNGNLFATVKVNPFRIGCLFPYVSAGLGVSWTQAQKNQQLNLLIGEKGEFETTNLHLPAIDQTNIGFRLGSGIDFSLTQNLLMSVGYSYNNLGKLTVRKASISMHPYDEDNAALIDSFHALQLGNLTSHNIEFSLRYLFS